MKKWIQLWVPVLAWMGMIFYSSAQPYGNQDMRPTLTQFVPEQTVEQLFSWVSFDYANYEISVAHLGAAGFLEFFLRKGAHFFVFFVLAILLYRAISAYGVQQAALLALFLTAAYAGFDEVHQSFTKDRTPLWQDSLLDTVGGICGLLLLLWISKLKKGV